MRKLTLVSAPAGFGKTTLVAAWLNKKKEVRIRDEIQSLASTQDGLSYSLVQPMFKIAWLSLDENDNDPVRFLTYLITAFRGAKTPLGASRNRP